MSDFGASISLSRDHSSSSSSDQAPLSPAPLSSGGARLTTNTNNNNNNNTVVEGDNNNHPRYPNNRQLMLATPIQRKPRGRPPGSKNKPKPPVIITRDSEPAVKSEVLNIPAGCCIMDRITKYAYRNNVGVSVVTASGTVAAVTLRQPAPHLPPVTLTGPYTIISLHGTFLGGCAAVAADANLGLLYSRPFGIVFSGSGQGHVGGGLISGPLVAASHVVVSLSTFADPGFHSMESDDDPADEDRKDGGGSAGGGGGGAGGNEGFGGGGGNGGGGVSTGMSMGRYGGTPINHAPKMSRTQDVLQWAASASHPPPAAY